MHVHAISKDCPILDKQFFSSRSDTLTFSLTAAILMGDVVKATRHLYQIQKKYFKSK
jgi:DNA polymerase III delta subunit